jgi:hypothetical protein
MLTQLERTGEDQISLTDPDSRAMAARTKVDSRLIPGAVRRSSASVDERAAEFRGQSAVVICPRGLLATRIYRTRPRITKFLRSAG